MTVQPRAEPRFGKRAGVRSPSPALSAASWKIAGALALLCSGVAWASLPRPADVSRDERRQWQALGIAPLSGGASTGLRMAATDSVEPVDFVPKRAIPVKVVEDKPAEPVNIGPIRIRGRAGDGLYWSLRAAGASPQVAAQYLAALATEIDVGGIGSGDTFDLVVKPGQEAQVLYAGLDRMADTDMQLVRWTSGGRSQWIDAVNVDRPAPVVSGMAWPVSGRITSYFGYRRHPILRYMRFHGGVDFGAGWGSPIVAAADGQVVRAGWAGGYGRQVRIAHAGGLTTSYSHMSSIVAESGGYVHAGQIIGYVGSSGLSTGPHLHYEVTRDGERVNPLAVRFASVQVADTGLANAVKARLKALLSVGAKKS